MKFPFQGRRLPRALLLLTGTLFLIYSIRTHSQKSADTVPPVIRTNYQNSSILLPFTPIYANKIPLIIHQTYKTNSPLDWKTEENTERFKWFMSWRIRNPDAIHIVWTDQQADWFMRTHFTGENEEENSRVYEAYSKLPLMVMKTDLFRYAVVWKHGGIYSDADTTCLKSVTEWFQGKRDAELITGIEWYPGFFSHVNAEDYYKKVQLVQWTFAAKPKHPMLKILITEIVNNILSLSIEHLQDLRNVESIGGPQVFTRAVQQYLMQNGESLDFLSVKNPEAWFEKSRVMVHPLYSFNARFAKRWISKATDFVDHHYDGFSANGWRQATKRYKVETQ